MKSWYSSQELAGIPGLPRTDRRIRARAESEKWLSRPREFGKGLEYHLSALPLDAQAALLARESAPILAAPLPAPPVKPARAFDPLIKAAGDARAAQLQGRAKARLDAKLAVLGCFTGLTGQALVAAVTRYNAGALDVPAETRAHVPTLSLASVYRLRDLAQRHGLARVAGRYGNRAGTGLIDTQPQLAAALRALLVEHPHVRPGFAHEWLRARYDALPAEIAGDGPLALPSAITVARWLARWKRENAELYCRLRDPDAWKSRYMLGWGDASAGILGLNDEWQADSTPADLLLADGGRHALLFLIDVWSRRLKIKVSKTSKAAAIASLLREGWLEWGVNNRLKTDHGQDYVAAHIQRICLSLSIEHTLCLPFQPWGKPHVERHIRTFLHDLVELLPGYIGHNVSEREQLRARQQFSDRLFVKDRTVELPGLSAAELQAFCDRWCAAYHARPHSGLDGLSPLAKAATWREPIRVLTDERALDLLLSEAPSDNGWRTVTKSYGLRVDSFEYIAIGLPVGERVRVLYDPEGDLGQVYVFDAKGAFLAIAECPEVTGVDRNALAAQAKATQKASVQADYRALKADAKALGLKDLAAELLNARTRAAATLLPFPTPTEPHTTPHLRGAAAALTGETALSGGEITPETLRAAWGEATPTPEPAPAPAPVVRLHEDFDSMDEAMRDVVARTLGRDQPISPSDARFVVDYYREVKNCRIFENRMTERYGFQRFHAWKSAVLTQTQQTLTA